MQKSSLSSLLRSAHPALFEGEGEGGGGRGRGGEAKKTTRFFNTFFPVYIHIQYETSKSNLSKTVRDREKVSMEVI